MFRYLPIRRINAREILDSRGNPTLEVEVTVGEGIMGIDGYTGRAMVPSGASTGSYEAVELRDEEENRYGGKGVTKAAEHVNTQLAEVLVGENALNQEYIDYLLKDTDGTENMLCWEHPWQWRGQRRKLCGCRCTAIWAAAIPQRCLYP